MDSGNASITGTWDQGGRAIHITSITPSGRTTKLTVNGDIEKIAEGVPVQPTLWFLFERPPKQT